jgi:hypothetical protein
VFLNDLKIANLCLSHLSSQSDVMQGKSSLSSMFSKFVLEPAVTGGKFDKTKSYFQVT